MFFAHIVGLLSRSRPQHSYRRRRHRRLAAVVIRGRKEERIQVRRPSAVRPPFSLSRPACCARSSSLSSLHLGWRLLAPARRRRSLLPRLRPAVPPFWSREGKKVPEPVDMGLVLARKRSLFPSVRPQFLCGMRLACKCMQPLLILGWRWRVGDDLDSGPKCDSCNISFDQGIESLDVTRFWVAHSRENYRGG